MKIKTAELVEALKRIQPGLATNEIIEQTSFFIFTGETIQTFNDEICVIVPDPTDGAIEGAVPSDEFYSVLSKITEEIIDLDQPADDEIRIRGKGMEIRLKIEEEIIVPFGDVNLVDADEDWQELPENFFHALKECQYATSKVSSRYPLMAYIMVSPKYVQATNGHKISRFELSSKLKIESFLVPSEIVSTLLGSSFAGLNEIARSSGWLHFRNEDGVMISARTVEDAVHKFPPIEKVLADRDTLGKIKLSDEQINSLKDALERALVFAKRKEEKDTMVQLLFKGKNIILSAQSSRGKIKERVSHTKRVENDMEIEINPNLLYSVLGTCRAFSIQKNRVMFETKEYQHGIVIK